MVIFLILIVLCILMFLLMLKPNCPKTSTPSPTPLKLQPEEIEIADDDLVVALIGNASSGKSSIMKALLGLEPQNTLIIVSAKSGSTMKPIAQVFERTKGKRRCIIVDVPGLDAKIAHENSKDIQSVTKHINDSMKKMDVCLFVTDRELDDSMEETYKKILRYCKEQKERVIIVCSKSDKYTHTENGLTNIKQQIQEKLQVPTKLIVHTTTRAWDPDLKQNLLKQCMEESKPGIEELKKMINDVLNFNEEKILYEKKCPSSFLPEMIAMSAATLAVWVPGMTTWGSLAGPVLLTMGPVGVVASVPLAVVVATGMLVRGGRKVTWWLNRPKNPSD